MKELIPLTVLFLTFTTLLFVIVKNIGIQKSISFSDKVLRKPFKGFFEATIFICGACLVWFANIHWNLLLFLGGSCIFLIGFFPLGDRPKWVMVPHMIFAISGYALSVIGSWLQVYRLIEYNNYSIYPFWLSILITISVSSAVFNWAKHTITGIEVVLSYSIFTGMVYNTILIYL